jgi:hypothetical protein
MSGRGTKSPAAIVDAPLIRAFDEDQARASASSDNAIAVGLCAK